MKYIFVQIKYKLQFLRLSKKLTNPPNRNRIDNLMISHITNYSHPLYQLSYRRYENFRHITILFPVNMSCSKKNLP